MKTAQQKGFGTMNFYKQTASYTMPANPAYADSFIKITATAKNGEVSPFFCQLAFDGTEDLVASGLVADSTHIEWTFYYYSLNAHTFTFEATGTSDFTLTATKGTAQ